MKNKSIIHSCRFCLAMKRYALAGMLMMANAAQAQVTSNWTTNANGNLSLTSNWDNGVPNGVGAVANFLNNISASRTMTNDLGVLVLGGLNFGTSNAGDFGYTIQSGTIRFENTEGNPAFINISGTGNSNTINSDMVIAGALDIHVAIQRNSRGLTLGTTAGGGVISGGTRGQTTLRMNSGEAENFVNWVLIRGDNSFEGQILVESGHLRLENRASAAGARGVGNEVVVNGTGRVDLRGVNFAVQADDAQIFMVEGAGPNGLGAFTNSTSTAQAAHLTLTGDTTVGGQSLSILARRRNGANTEDIAPILDLGGNTLTKIGISELRLHNADIQNGAGAVWNIHEGILKFENRGALDGGALIGGTTYGNNIDGMTFNVSYNDGAYDGMDPLNGSRTSDLFNPNRTISDTLGYTVIAARLAFRTDWTADVNRHVANTKVVETYDDVTVNLNYGAFQREGGISAGQTFDHVFGSGSKLNLVGGGVGQNILSITGGSSSYNSAISAYDHPGVTEWKGSIANEGPGLAGMGFTSRGNRELRLSGANPDFTGDVLVKQNTSRWMAPNYTNSTGAHESQFFNMSLAGPDGTLNRANSITLTRWGSLGLLNSDTEGANSRGGFSSANHNDRLNDNGSVLMRDGIVYLETHSTLTNTENFGHVGADQGTNYIYLDTRAGGRFDGAMESLTRRNSGVLKITSMNGGHTWASEGDAEVRLEVKDASQLTLTGADNPGSPDQRIVLGVFGSVVPETFAERTGSAVTRTDHTNQQAYAYGGSGMGLMTLEQEGGRSFIRPLTASEYHVGGVPMADANWMVDRYISAADGPFAYADRRNYEERNVTADTIVNSLSLSWNAALSGQVVPTGERDYVIIEEGNVLTIRSGIVNFNSFTEAVTANLTASIRGGRLDMGGQTAILNSGMTWQDTDSNSGTWSTFVASNSSFMRSPMIHATGLVKTGRTNIYLETWNDLTGNVHVSEQGGLFLRHPGALGQGAEGREVQVSGAGNFYLEYGTNIHGVDLRATNSFDTSRTILAAIGATHSTWGGDIILDTADAAGSTEFQAHVLTARNNGTLSVYGNIYTANNTRFTDNDSWGDPQVISTAVGETATLNLYGQVRDTVTGALANVGATGDNATRLDRNHSLVFQMRGHDEINVNAHQQWNATGSIFATQGYFRIMYDPAAAGLDGGGFQTNAARTAITQDNQWNQMTLGGYQNFYGIGNSATNAYHGHILLTRQDQVLNFADRIIVTNNNRNHTLTLGGEHESGTAYVGSVGNDANYRILFQNSNAERDLRVLQVRGGTLVVNARLEDSNTTVNSFNASVSMTGPGTVIFNRNAVGNSTVDRWNFLAGTTVWAGANGNNQFARTWTSGSEIGSVSGWGGGVLELADPGGTTMRTQSLNGAIYLFKGSSGIRVNQNTTMTVGAAARPFRRDSGATMAFYENGNGVIHFSAPSLTTTAGAFLAPWAVQGNDTDGITDWAGRQGTTGVQAFTSYDADVFGPGYHTNLTSGAQLAGVTSTDTLRFGAGVNLEIAEGGSLQLAQGGILVPASVTGDTGITGGALTSAWSAGGNDLLLHHHGQGRLVVDSVITNDAGAKVNLVLAGGGTTVLRAENTHTGSTYLNNGVLQISSDAQLGRVDGSIERIVLIGAGSSYTNGTSGNGVVFEGGGNGTGAAATFNTSSNTTASSRVVNNISLSQAGSGYDRGVRVVLNDGTGSNAGAWAVLDSGNLHFNGGVLHATESFALNSGRTIFLGGNGGTLRVDVGKTLTIDGFITGDYSHVHGGNGYTSADGRGNAWDAASVRNPDIGDLTVDGGGTVVLRYSPDGTGLTPGNLAHAYGGITWINEGVLRLEGVGSTGAVGALGTHRSFLDSTVIGANGTLNLFFASSDPSIQEWFTLRGQGYQGGGTFASTVPGTARVYNLAGQIYVEQDALFNVRNNHNFYLNNGGGAMYGQGSITYTGNGSLRLYGNNPDWTGALRSASGTTYLASAANVQGMSGLELQRNSFMVYSAGSTSVSEFRDRLPDTMPITTNGWTRLRMDATGGAHSGLEKTGTLTVQAGVMGIEYNLGSDIIANAPRLTGDWAGWHFTEIVREPGAIVAVRNLDAGTRFGGAAFGSTPSETTDRALLLVDTAPVSVGGNGAAFNHGIVPGFFGGTRDLWFNLAGTGNLFTEEFASRHLMTVETAAHPHTGAAVHVLRPLEMSEYRVLASGVDANLATPDSTSLDIAGATGQNVLFAGRTGDELGVTTLTARRNSTLTLGQNASVNSLTIMTESFVNGAGGSRGNTATVILDDLAALTLDSGVLNISNSAVQDMNGAAHNTGTNADIRTFIRGGQLDFNGREAIIQTNSRWIHYNTSDALNAYREVDVDNTQVFINSSIVNTGGHGLTKTGTNALYLQTANTYTGDTTVTHGLLFARHNQALGQSTRVNVTGAGGFGVGLGVEVSGVDVHIGTINGNNTAFLGEQGSIFRGNIIIDNVDLAGATGYTRTFTPRIYNNSSSIFILDGDIYGGSTPVAQGIRATESRIFSTYTGAQGIFDIRGRIMDGEMGALDALVTAANQNQVLRMEILDTTSENNIQLWQPYESAGRIRLLRGVLRFMGEGHFYSDDALAVINPENAMSGFQMGGRGVVNTAGTGDANLALVLAKAGAVFNLSSWEVGVESTDRDNISGHDNFNRGNTTGNRTLAGENRSGTVTFGTGEGGITFVNDERFGGYDAPLQLYAAEGGRVDLRAALLDGGDGVNSSITKVGLGDVRLLGSTLGDSTVEGVNVLGGFLSMEGYDVNASRRVGQGAALRLGGGGLVLNAGVVSAVEDFGAVSVNAGGSAVVAVGAGELNLTGAFTRAAGGQVHFQSIAGGIIRAVGVASGSRLGSWATFGVSLTNDVVATDWAATDGSGRVVAFSDYDVDAFGAGLHTDVVGAGLAGGTTGSLRFHENGGTITSGTLLLQDGGLLFTSDYAGGVPIGTGVGLSAATGDLIVQNFSPAEVTLAGDISGGSVVFNGTGRTALTGVVSHTGTTFITGASTLVVDAFARLGTSSGLHLNGGVLEVQGAGLSEAVTQPVVLGGNDGVLRIMEADSRVILRAAAVNQITSEANPISTVSTNPFSGGLKLEGAGTFQFGSRTVANNAQDLLGVNNNYTGHTTLGDGVNALRVEVQGQVNNNGQINPFGTHVGWMDSTLVRNNAKLEFGVRRGDGSRNGQVRVREWFEWGASVDDVTRLLVSTQREVALEGINRVTGTLEITLQNQNYSDMGSNAANAQSSIYFGLNEGSLIGDGRIVVNPAANPAGNTYGTLQIRESIPDFTGDFELAHGYLAFYGLGYTQGTGTSPILLGVQDSTSNHRVDVRMLTENGTNGSATLTTAFDAPNTELTFYRDIRVADNSAQDVRIYSGYIPANGSVNWTGAMDFGDSPTQTVRFYFEDTENLDPLLAGHQQHVLMNFTGNLSGNRRLLLEVNEGGDLNQTLPLDEGGRSAADVHRTIFTTFVLGGDNSAFAGDVRVSAENTGAAIDKDDIAILRFGSDLGLTAQNTVILQSLSAMQAGGHDVTIGALSTLGGNSTSGLYSFIDYEWASGRESLYDLDHVVGINQGTNGKNLTVLGGSSEIIENASANPGSITITQNTNSQWDAFFRDGQMNPLIDGASGPAASLSIVKAGTAVATMTIFNAYSGTTTVSEGMLQVGQGGTGQWQLLAQGNTIVRTAVDASSGNRAVGSTGTGLTIVESGAGLSGTGHVRGSMVVRGTLAPGDNAGAELGTLFVGGQGSSLFATLTIEGGTLSLQASAPTVKNNALSTSGTYTINDLINYEAFVAGLPVSYEGTAANPLSFGQAGTHIVSGAQHDHVEVSNGLIWQGGQIELLAGVGFSPEAGDVYNLLDWYGVSDWTGFDEGERYRVGGEAGSNLFLPDLSTFGEALRWDTGLFTSHGMLLVAIVPEPSRMLLVFLGFATLLMRRRRY